MLFLGISPVSSHCSAPSAAILPKLNRGAFNVGVGTEHAAVSGFRPKNGVTRLTLKEDKARFSRHLSFGPRSTVRAGNYRPRDYLHVTSCNAYLASLLRRKANQPQQSAASLAQSRRRFHHSGSGERRDSRRETSRPATRREFRMPTFRSR